MNENAYEKLTIANDFIFSKVMRNPKLCKAFLEYILEERIAYIEYPDYQKTIDLTVDAKSVRLDVYVEDAVHTVYNVEMQTTREKYLPKRSRYYQGMIDLNLIEKGEHYKKLKRSYVIFVCTFDPFHRGRHKYTFENLCLEDRELHLGDETIKVFINTRGTQDDVSEEVKEIFEYFNGAEATGEYAKELHQEVIRVKQNKEWRLEYMTLLLREREKYEEGLERGIEQGIEKGIEQGIEQGIEKGIEQGIVQGIEQGIQLTKRIYQLAAQGHEVNEIAAKLQISVDEVKRILKE